jgi:hypothetical protein
MGPRLLELPEPGAGQLGGSETGTGGAHPITDHKQAVPSGQIVLVDLPGVFTLHMVG